MPSSVPLASVINSGGKHELEDESDSDGADSGATSQQQTPNPSVNPGPSQAAYAGMLAGKIADDVRAAGSARAKKTVPLSQQPKTAVAKSAQEIEQVGTLDKCRILAEKMNKYRKNLTGKIDYVFKKEYTPDMGYDNLMGYIKSVDAILNSKGADVIVTRAIKLLAGLFELGAVTTLAPTGQNPVGIKADLHQAIDNGEFSTEILQISIDLHEWLARGPYSRTMEMFAEKLWIRCELNSTASANRPVEERAPKPGIKTHDL